MYGTTNIFTKEKNANRSEEIQTICGVECYEKNGTAYLRLETVARGLGFARIAASGNEVVRWETVRKYLIELGVPTSWHENSQPIGKEGLPEFIPENIFYRLAMKAKNEVAEKFQAKVADEIIPSIRRTGEYSSGKSKVENAAFMVKFIADDLRVNEASRLLMYENMCKDFNIPTGFLPKYEHNGNHQMKAASTLLKENNCGMSAVKFNSLLVGAGYLEERERPSSKGNGTRKFKALTEKGLKYGENAVSPHNQKEVQPLYYSDMFMELYNNVID